MVSDTDSNEDAVNKIQPQADILEQEAVDEIQGLFAGHDPGAVAEALRQALRVRNLEPNEATVLCHAVQISGLPPV